MARKVNNPPPVGTTVVTFLADNGGASYAWTDITNGDSHFPLAGLGPAIRRVWVRGLKKVRVHTVVMVAANAGAQLGFKWGTDGVVFGSGTITGALIDATGHKTSAWFDVQAGTDELYYHLYNIGGDGVTDPAFRYMALEFKAKN